MAVTKILGAVPSDRPLLLIDAECSFCVAQAERLERIGRRQVEVQPLQAVTFDDPRLTEAELRKEVKLITPQGEVYGGAEALVHVLVLGRPSLRWVTSVYFSPIARRAVDGLYGLIARNRYRLFGSARGALCSDDHCANY